MAAIEDLINQVADPGLRDQLAAEVARLKSTKKFGLVFEEHLPEMVRLPGLVVRVGARVFKKDDERGISYRVSAEVNGKKIKIAPEAGGPEETVERDSVVVAKAFGEPMYPALIQVDAIERAPGKPWHVLINAENYHALQLLLYGYERKVDVIYIDPPYNSGARDWKYNNDYVDDTDQFRHSKWLAMMKRRLLLAKRLLNPAESVLIVTIDEKEYLRLGLVLKQVFPEARIQMVSSVINHSGVAREKQFYRAEEYLFFVFVGNAAVIPTGDDMLNPLESFEGKKIDLWRRLLRSGTNARRQDGVKQFYPFWIDAERGCIHSIGDFIPLGVSPDTVGPPAPNLVACWPIRLDDSEGNWQISAESSRRGLKEGTVRLGTYTEKRGRWSISYLRNAEKRRIKRGEIEVLGKDKNGALILKQSETIVRVKNPVSVWNQRSHNAGAGGSNVVRAVLPGRNFPFPKSLYAVEDALRFFVKEKPDAVILDFFSGSGTTAHAVMRLNKQHGGKRQCISVTNNEVGADEQKALREQGLRPGDENWEKWGICDYITKPRIEAAITGKTPDGKPIKGDYKFKDEFPMSDGFNENAAYFKLDFLDPGDVTRGEKFEAIVPILWMLAGCRGECELSKGSGKWFIPKNNPYAVLLKEDYFGEFAAKLAERSDIDHIFLVTDSTEAFHEMTAELGNLRGGGQGALPPTLPVVHRYIPHQPRRAWNNHIDRRAHSSCA